jgi:cation transport protein ChaC
VRTPPPLNLTPDLVARVPLPAGPAVMPEGVVPHTDEEIAALVDAKLAEHDRSADVAVFAFGSLLWNPGVEFEGDLPGVARGWHRAFRIRLAMHRGTTDLPGLMMGLDRGGTCKGAVLTIPARHAEERLHQLFKREMPMRRPAGVPTNWARWIVVETDAGPRRAIAFVLNRRGTIYTGRLSLEETVDTLARAAGTGGSCAEYLYRTVEQLHGRGIHDRNLWRLQSLVAERLRAIGSDQIPPAGDSS